MNTRTAIGVVALVCSTPVSGAEEKSAPPKEPAKKEEKVDLAAQLETEKMRLHQLLAKYLPKHPMVIAQQRRIADLEEQIAKSKRKSP